MKITVKNILGCKSGEVNFNKPYVFLLGRNGHGKSSFLRAVGATLARRDNPLGVSATAKSNYRHAGADKGECRIDTSHGNITWDPTGGYTSKGEPPISSEWAMALVNPTAVTKPKARQELWTEALQLEMSRSDVANLLEPVEWLTPTHKSNLVTEIIEHGWDTAMEYQRERGRSMKREWCDLVAKTGQAVSYGAKIASNWVPPDWNDKFSGVPIEDAEAEARATKERVDALAEIRVISQHEAESVGEKKAYLKGKRNEVKLAAEKKAEAAADLLVDEQELKELLARLQDEYWGMSSHNTCWQDWNHKKEIAKRLVEEAAKNLLQAEGKVVEQEERLQGDQDYLAETTEGMAKKDAIVAEKQAKVDGFRKACADDPDLTFCPLCNGYFGKDGPPVGNAAFDRMEEARKELEVAQDLRGDYLTLHKRRERDIGLTDARLVEAKQVEKECSAKVAELKKTLEELAAKEPDAPVELTPVESSPMLKKQKAHVQESIARHTYASAKTASLEKEAEEISKRIDESLAGSVIDPAEVAKAGKAHAAALVRVQCITLKKQSENIVEAVDVSERLVHLLGPQGARLDWRTSAFEELQASIRMINEATGWHTHLDTATLEITWDGRLITFCSRSEAWRADFTIRAAMTLRERAPLLIADDVEVLDLDNISSLIKLVKRICANSPTRVLCATASNYEGDILKDEPSMKDGILIWPNV